MNGSVFWRRQAGRWSLPVACGLLMACLLPTACGRHVVPAATHEGASAGLREGDSISLPTDSPLRLALRIEAASETTFERPISVPGVIESNPASVATVASPRGDSLVHSDPQRGDAASAGKPLHTVAESSRIGPRVWFSTNVPEKDVAALFVGQRAWIALDGSANDSLAGRISSIGDVLDEGTNTVKVRIALDHGSARLHAGMAETAVFSGSPREAITVPATALIGHGVMTHVFVEQRPWHYTSRRVTSGLRIGSEIEVASGLKHGERIVVKNGAALDRPMASRE